MLWVNWSVNDCFHTHKQSHNISTSRCSVSLASCLVENWTNWTRQRLSVTSLQAAHHIHKRLHIRLCAQNTKAVCVPRVHWEVAKGRRQRLSHALLQMPPFSPRFLLINVWLTDTTASANSIAKSNVSMDVHCPKCLLLKTTLENVSIHVLIPTPCFQTNKAICWWKTCQSSRKH